MLETAHCFALGMKCRKTKALTILCAIVLLSRASIARAVESPAAAPQDGKQALAAAGLQGEGGEHPEQPQPNTIRRGKPSLAERIARMQRAVEADQQQISALKNGSETEDEYRESSHAFEELDEQRTALRRQIELLRTKSTAAEIQAIEAQERDLQTRWQAAKDRFDLAIQERAALREKAAALENKLRQDQDALDGLSDGASQPLPAGLPPALASPSRTAPNRPSPNPRTERAEQTQTAAAASATGVAAPAANSAPAAKDESPEGRAELMQALKAAQEKEAAAKASDQRAESVAERFEALRRNIDIEQRLLTIARAKSDQALSERTNLDKELQRTLTENPANLTEVWGQIGAVEERFRQARAESRATQNRLNDLQNELNSVQHEQIAVLRRAKQMHEEALAARGQVAKLQNPFTVDNLVQWLFNHCPKLGTILLATFFVHLLVNLSSRHITRIVARTVDRGTQRERENRAVTLVAVFRNTASLAILVGGILMALDEVGIPIMPLMGGAAVIGLAVAFGAQNLVRDYFSGFMVLLEDQYGINDVVRIGDVSGTVEKITLRMSVLRDLEGVLHFVPHGSITRVSNLTHGWSRAVIEVGISYSEDPDYVMGVLMDLARELRQDPVFGPSILDEPEMLGLERLGDYAVVLKFVLKTHPLKRWLVRREMLLRIKRRFDELGIEIPFPQSIVYNRQESEPRTERNRARLGKTA